MQKTDLTGVTDFANLSPEDINSIAEGKGKFYATNKITRPNGKPIDISIKTSQIRNFYSSIVSIREKFKIERKLTEEIERDLILLKPKLAYSVGRQSKDSKITYKDFYDLITIAIDLTTQSSKKEKAFQNFLDLIEAIVAYHRFNNGE